MSDKASLQEDSQPISADLQFINSGYRLVSDDAAFADCVLAWTKKLAKAEAEDSDPSIDDDALVSGYINGVQGLLEKLNSPKEPNPIDEAVSEIDAAAMVITPQGIVVAANVDARQRFDAVQGQKNRLKWLDPVSSSDFQAVVTSTQTLTNQPSQHAIVRTSNERHSRGMAEVYALPIRNGESHYIVIRALETKWAPAVDIALKQAFNLTAAEREVARGLYETRDTAQIAGLRKTTSQTIRTQIRTILRKTDTTSQVDLIRLIGLLNARASHGLRSKHLAWRDPWGNYRILRGPNGKQIAYSWTGDEHGVPAVLIHGSIQGYLLGDAIEHRLKSEGIRLYAVIRPGFGDSDSCSETNSLEEQADAIGWLVDQLGLQGSPAIGLGNGCASLYYLAAKRPNLFSRLLVTGLVKPYSNESIARFTPTQRVTIKLLRYAPKTSVTLAKICYRYVQQKGANWYLAHGWNDVPEAKETLANPDIIPFIRNACELTLTANVRDYLQEMQTQWNLDPEIIEKVACPVSHLHGEFDRSVTVEEAAELAGKMPNFTSEEVPDAGYFLPYEKPEFFAERIVKAVLG
ncbi:MAG: alpha/beta hydrolase [Pseudomonadota bacterium]